MITTGANLTGTVVAALNTYLALAGTITFVDMGTAAQVVRPHYLLDEEPSLQDVEKTLAANGRAAHVLTLAGVDTSDPQAQDLKGTVVSGVGVLTSYARTPVDTLEAFHRLIAAINRNDNYTSALVRNRASEWTLGGLTFYEFFPLTFPKAAQVAKGKTATQSVVYVTGSAINFTVQIEAPA